MTSLDDLPRAEFGFPGPLRDKLVAAILSGEKTSTTGLHEEYDKCGDPLPRVGERRVMVDSRQRPVAVLETTDVRVLPLREVDLAHVIDEGEGDRTLVEWRASHEGFWHSPAMREVLGDPGFTVTDATLVVAERFRLVDRLT